MFQEKIKQLLNTIKQSIKETFKLLYKFKWYIASYLIYFIINICSLFKISAEDDKIFHTETASQLWSYTNQKVYIGGLKLEILILILLFFIGTSNMRNHPWLAKAIFLSPWVYMTICLVMLF